MSSRHLQLPHAAPGPDATLADWLTWQETLNPAGIELGLERVERVAHELGLQRQSFAAVLVAGTNGKGSTVAFLSALFEAAGQRVARYTSPFLQRFNESLVIAGEPASDAQLVEAFCAVERARLSLSEALGLTWFEFRTLACGWLIQRAQVDVAVLEIGLGGRLDAVNIFQPEVSIVTTVGLDHEAYLGDSVSAIAREKAGVMREAKPTVLGDCSALQTLRACAREVGAELHVPGRDYFFEPDARGGLRFRRREGDWLSFAPFAMRGRFQLQNASSALAAADLMPPRLRPAIEDVGEAICSVVVDGRMQVYPGSPSLLFDVAHNPQAAHALAGELNAMRARGEVNGKISAVIGIYRDKNVEAIGAALAEVVDYCAAVALPSPRAESAQRLASRLSAYAENTLVVEAFESFESAVDSAARIAQSRGLVVIGGSFETVRLARQLASTSAALETAHLWSSRRGPEFG